MAAHGYPLAATILLLLPMLYFLLASVTFLLARLSDPIVTWLLRGLFDTYFIALVTSCTIGILAFLAADRPGIVAAIAALAIGALGARRWFLRRLDIQIRARDAGQPQAVRHLRRLHLGGMLYNAIQTGLVVASIPAVFTAT